MVMLLGMQATVRHLKQHRIEAEMQGEQLCIPTEPGALLCAFPVLRSPLCASLSICRSRHMAMRLSQL